MKNIRDFGAWRAEEIAKVFLLNTKIIDIYPDSSNKFDFIVVGKLSSQKRIGIEIKATKYSKSEITKKYNQTTNKFIDSSIPVIIMYIDYDNEKGFFQVINRGVIDEIKTIDTKSLSEKISIII